MKQIEIFFRTFLFVVFVFLAAQFNQLSAQNAEPLDSVELSLITCSPHEEVYSLYGHTAIRLIDSRSGRDLTFNYGVFNFKAPHFVLRFVFGKTDYELGILPTEMFCDYYKQWGSEVQEQVLNLTAEEKALLLHALGVNLKPENRVYRYNFFYDNCSTRPRDIITRNIVGRVVFEERLDFAPSYRVMIHEMDRHHPWAAFGNDLLLGVRADFSTTRQQQEFLPMNLKYDFDHAQIISPDGSSRPLVKQCRVLVEAGEQVVEPDFPLDPLPCALLLLAFFLIVMAVEWRRHACLVWVDAAVMCVTGLLGCVLVVMFFSEHPATSTNLQAILFNPVHLFYIPSVLRRNFNIRYWNVLIIMIVLFLLGSIWQDYAEGMEILALCLLSRYLSHKRNDK